jgi:hypothetical protein
VDADTRAYLDAFRRELPRHLADAMASAREETRRDLTEAMAAARDESRRDLAEATASTRDETRRDLTEAMATLRAEMRTEAAETRRHFDVVAEGLRGDIRLVAEGVVASTESIERLRSDVTREMNEHFRVVHLAFADVRRELG